jgi:hypothetical protein
LNLRGARAATRGLDGLHAEALELLAVMRADRAQPHLDQTVRKLLFHDACEGRSMRAKIPLVAFVDIGMCVDVQDRESRLAPPQRPQDRVSDGMIAAETDQRVARVEYPGDPRLDHLPGIRPAVERDVAVVYNPSLGGDVDSRLAPLGVGVTLELLADQSGCFGRTPHVRGVLVVRNAEK